MDNGYIKGVHIIQNDEVSLYEYYQKKREVEEQFIGKLASTLSEYFLKKAKDD